MRITYRPFAGFQWFAYLFFLPMTISLFVLLILYPVDDFVAMLKFMAVVLSSAIGTSMIIIESRWKVLFLENGILIQKGKFFREIWIPWDAVVSCETMKNYKNHNYWVLASRKLTKKERSRCVNHCVMSGWHHGAIAIPRTSTSDRAVVAEIDRLLKERFPA